MARTISTILQGLKDSFVSYASASGLVVIPSNWSSTDYKLLTLNTVAEQVGITEQLYDSFSEDMEDSNNRLKPQINSWIQEQFLNVFEYSSVGVPILQLNSPDFIPNYSNPNPNYRIIKYFSLVPTSFGVNIIKIAKDLNGLPEPLTSNEKAAASTFIKTIGVPGIYYEVKSDISDKIFMQLDVYYNGLYSSVIEPNVINGIKGYLSSLNSDNGLNGVVKPSFLKQAILNVEGVIDCSFDNIQTRADSTSVGNGTNLILNNTELLLSWQTQAGYIIPEDTSGANWSLTDFRVGSSGIKNLNLISQ